MDAIFHAPPGYVCPLCLTVQGIESDQTMAKQADIFFRDDLCMALVNSKFVGIHPGHVIVIPLKHYENLYTLPEDIMIRIMQVSQRVAIALKEVTHCDGIMVQQNNEPASGQHAFHYHMHLFPRFTDDHLHDHMLEARVSTPEERLPLATALRTYFNTSQ